MKKILTGIILILIFNFTQSQIHYRTCGTPPPSKEWDEWFNKEVEKYREKLKSGKVAITNYTIPVIVHILHTGQPVGTYPNIDSNRVKAQIRVLNEDFGGTPYNPQNITHFNNLIANTGIQFCLAEKDPNGNPLPEKGINRINSQTTFSVNPATQNNIQTFINNTVKPATIWDPTKYLNIWISEQGPSSSLLGYATFPAGTSLPGIGGGGTATSDGIWVVTNAFGSNAPGYAPGPNYATNYDLGRTATHEIGHWLGLRHVWGDGNCLTDFCNDTPPAEGPHFGCPSPHPYHVNQCGAGQSPNGEMTMNFMDYTDDRCMIMFTPDQTTRMQTAMSQGTFRSQLGTHGLCNAVPQCTGAAAPVASFSFASPYPCVGYGFSPVNTTSACPSPIFNWIVTPATATLSPGANVAAPSISLATGGTYTITLIATNSLGTSSYSAVYNATQCPKPPKCLDTLRMIKNTDTLITYNAPTSTIVLGCNNPATAGFLTGTSCYKDKEFAQYFPATSYSDTPNPQLNAVFVLFNKNGTKSNLPSTMVKCNVWGGNLIQGPTSLIGQKADSLAKIVQTVVASASTIASPTNQVDWVGTPTYTFASNIVYIHKFVFNPPALLPTNGFFAGLEMPPGNTPDSVLIFSNTYANAGPNDSTAFVRVSNNTWFKLKDVRNNRRVNLAIIPQISCRPPVGMNEQLPLWEQVFAFPNPNDGEFSIVMAFEKARDIQLTVYNYLGQIILRKSENNVMTRKYDINLGEHAQGVYFIEISDGKDKVVKKLIVE